MRVIAVANQKGGVGKTTSSVALGGLIAAEGQRVLLLDLDPHGSLSTYFRQDPDVQELSSYTLFQERKSLTRESVRRLIKPTDFPNLDLLPATTALATLERQAIGQDGMGLVIQRALAQIREDYDYVIIDSPPLLGVLMINALAACQWLVVPVQTEFLALKGLEKMVNTLSMMSRSRKKPLYYSIVPVMFDRRTQASVTSLRTIRNTYPEHTWAGHIPVDTRFRDASKAGVPPHLFDSAARGVDAYSSLWTWLKKSLLTQEQADAAAPANTAGVG
ncbi:ParA family protein [Cellvibrio japonicus]|uniref:ParA family protein n=1 Tax=Cellvibrio japonicus (strain Ueda107) TaxID=498211 RepID=B3PIJ4_CELJU|nr:ParA family protein [Cellvibrio japonicus]ACE83045.1 ParA family protein [Cellvibrio japonicus Ueda107]QEI12590.1 ParA family protein [Cellvibrio japonicus]QEI16164.1 ParA family protein [Cellvibrio japonicus]QEI19742.1 ParA family protein [Cellvibrio japonicus]